jgi:hypothetical protein
MRPELLTRGEDRRDDLPDFASSRGRQLADCSDALVADVDFAARRRLPRSSILSSVFFSRAQPARSALMLALP